MHCLTIVSGMMQEYHLKTTGGRNCKRRNTSTELWDCRIPRKRAWLLRKYGSLGMRRAVFFLCARLLETVSRKCPLNARHIKVVGAKNFQISKLIAETKLMVSLEFVSMAGAADTLKVFAAVWIACA